MGADLSSPTNDRLDDEAETIGSRLRKRRRTGLLPTDGASLGPKTSTAKKTASPHHKRGRATTVIKEATEEQDSILIPYIEAYDTNSSLQDDSIQSTENNFKRASTTNGHAINGILQSPSEINDGPSSPDTVSQNQELLPISSVAPDLAAVIASIIEHGEAVERRYGEMGQVDTESFGFLGASHHLKTQSLPILDNLVSLRIPGFERWFNRFRPHKS